MLTDARRYSKKENYFIQKHNPFAGPKQNKLTGFI
jgi:hypothetical protein